MTFQTHTLPPPIDAYIESMFHYKDFMPDHSIERVVPTGHIFILFELDGIPRNTYDNETLEPKETFEEVWISGMHSNYISISAHPESEMFVIQFKPYGAYPFFHFPVQNLNEQVLPGEAVFGEEILQLRKKILDRETSDKKFAIAEEWLTERFDNGKTPSKKFLEILKKLQNEPAAKLNGLAQHYPYTQKHLIDQFKKFIGLTPKYYHRINRFNDILKKIQDEENIKWSEIAYLLGYSDQSHFIKEFKHFSGFNPEEFIENDFHRDVPNFFPLDRNG